MSPPRSRFCGGVAFSAVEDGYLILLDGKPVKTPASAPLRLPSVALAEAVAEEWRAQGDKIRPASMGLTKLANTAIDRIASDRQPWVEQILRFGTSDLLCYRGEHASLAARQALAWDPLLQWADSAYGVKLKTASGLCFIEQPHEAILALMRVITSRDDFVLAGLNAATTLSGSAVIALALADGRLDVENAFVAAHLDEIYQWERWGKDDEAAAKAEKERRELTEIARFIRSARR